MISSSRLRPHLKTQTFSLVHCLKHKLPQAGPPIYQPVCMSGARIPEQLQKLRFWPTSIYVAVSWTLSDPSPGLVSLRAVEVVVVVGAGGGNANLGGGACQVRFLHTHTQQPSHVFYHLRKAWNCWLLYCALNLKLSPCPLLSTPSALMTAHAGNSLGTLRGTLPAQAKKAHLAGLCWL